MKTYKLFYRLGNHTANQLGMVKVNGSQIDIDLNPEGRAFFEKMKHGWLADVRHIVKRLVYVCGNSGLAWNEDSGLGVEYEG